MAHVTFEEFERQICEKCGETTQLCPECIQDWIENAKDKLREEFERQIKDLREELTLQRKTWPV